MLERRELVDFVFDFLDSSAELPEQSIASHLSSALSPGALGSPL
jgi:hypothetical protein